MANKSNEMCDIFGDFSLSFQESIQNIIKQEDYVKYRVEKKIIHKAGNCTSFLFEVDIFGETAVGEKVTSLFVKKPFTLDKITVVDVSHLYSRELFIYKELSKIFLSLQNTAKVPEMERFTFLKSYESDNEAIIMENLSKKGYITYNKMEVVPLRFAELSIIQLAKFHALSYVIKKRFPKYFEDKIKIIRSPYNLNSDWEEFIHNICAVVVQIVKDEHKAKMTNYAPRMIETYNKYINDIVPINGCLCHGDYKFHNIMVKEVNGEASAVQPIDYQIVYYASPVNDFLFFIFSSTDREFRKKYLSYLKDLYFKNFTIFLGYFNIDVNSVYSRQDFENDYEERLDLGLMFGLYLAAFNYAQTEEGFDVSKLTLAELPIVPDEMFIERVRGIVEDYIEWGYL